MPDTDWLFARPIAHRGLHDRASGLIENSAGAADAAIGGGYGIECDVQPSADGEAVVFHDRGLDRLTGATGDVAAFTAAALGRMALRGSTDTIPTLGDFLDRISGRTAVVVEIKSRFDGDHRLARRVAAIVAGRARVAIKSFDPDVVRVVRTLAPDVACGLVVQARYAGPDYDRLDEGCRRDLSDLLHWDRTRPDFLSWQAADLSRAAGLKATRAVGLPIMSWTIRSSAEASAARAVADQIVFEQFRPASPGRPFDEPAAIL